MAKDLNKVMIIGRLGTEPEMRYTSNGSPVTTFRVASCRQWKDSSGDIREETEWFSVVTWNKLAEICNQHLGKNSRVYLEGRLQTRSWEDHLSGHTRYKTEIVANDMIILDSNRNVQRENCYPSDENDEDGSIGVSRSLYRTSDEEPDTYPPLNLDIGDDDIPF
ncbi:MAG: single-stranded DNA-binding protein [Chloroflexaceae bacterium]|nr:single-stranded DNA-binding protein [Chloroflexaceae bacterium]